MSHPWIEPNACPSLAVLVESVIAARLMEHSAAVCLEAEIDPELEVPCDPERTVDLIRTLVNQSLEQMSDGGELTVTAFQGAGTVELELADTGGSLETRATRLPLAAAAIGAKVSWQNCPQGGVAATITFPYQQQSRRNAA